LTVACLAALKVEQTADYLVAPKVASKVESSAARTDDCSADSTAAHWAVHWAGSLVACLAASTVEWMACLKAAPKVVLSVGLMAGTWDEQLVLH